MNVWVEILGCVAGILTSSSFVPQFIKLKKQRIALGVSIQTYVFACVGSLIWLLYGTFKHSIALILFNLFNVVISICIIYLVKKFNFNALD